MKKVKNLERGQALVLIVVAVIALVGITALAVDGSMAYNDRRQAQNASDSAALAVALKIANGMPCNSSNIAALQTAGRSAASAVGYDDAATSVDVTVECLPGNTTDAKVTINTTINTYFAKVVGVNQVTNKVTSTARGASSGSSPIFDGYGIAALAPDGIDYDMAGSFALYVKNSNLFVNSSANTSSVPSLLLDGNPRIYLDPGFVVNTVATGTYATKMCSWCTPLPTVVTGASPYSQADIDAELGKVPGRPDAPTCPVGTAGAIVKTGHAGSIADPYVITAGDYPTGLNTEGSGWYTMQSGTYCFTGTAGFQGDNVSGVYSPNSDVKIVTTGSLNVRMEGSTDFWLKSLEVYTENGLYYLGGGANLFTDKFRYISSGTGIMQVASDAYICKVSAGFAPGTSTTPCTASDSSVPDAFMYFTGGKPVWDAGAKLYLHTPPEGDPFSGLLVYLPWSNTSAIEMVGGTSYALTGTFLAPHSTIHIGAGNATDTIRSQFIGYRFDLDGGAALRITYNASDNFRTGSPSIELLR
jgi:Flp pilus assembly protein TadG